MQLLPGQASINIYIYIQLGIYAKFSRSGENPRKCLPIGRQTGQHKVSLLEEFVKFLCISV